MTRKDDELDRITGAIMAGAEHAISVALARYNDQVGRSLDGLRAGGAQYRTIVADTNTLLAGSACRLYGFMLTENTGTATATLGLHDGTTTDGQLVGTVTLNPGESTRDTFGPNGVTLTRGLYVTVAGAIAGSVFILGGLR